MPSRKRRAFFFVAKNKRWGERPREPRTEAGVGSPGVLPHQQKIDPLHGYTRLRILSFERLAEFVLAALQTAPPNCLARKAG